MALWCECLWQNHPGPNFACRLRARHPLWALHLLASTTGTSRSTTGTLCFSHIRFSLWTRDRPEKVWRSHGECYAAYNILLATDLYRLENGTLTARYQDEVLGLTDRAYSAASWSTTGPGLLCQECNFSWMLKKWIPLVPGPHLPELNPFEHLCFHCCQACIQACGGHTNQAKWPSLLNLFSLWIQHSAGRQI